MTEANRQSAYNLGRIAASSDVEADIVAAARAHYLDDLGRTDGAAKARAVDELSRQIPKNILDELHAEGVRVDGRRVLDLGAGLGGMSEELALRGADVIALEPGTAWANITERRVARHGGKFTLLRAFGEQIPLPDDAVDVIVSIQVLEHTRDPNKVLAEAWRVLRPGGHFFMSCENYLAFREPHYQVPWFPLLPKPLGSLYLKLLGRSPQFLLEAITYTTQPGVLRAARRLGFVRARERQLRHSLSTKTGIKWSLLRGLANITGGAGPFLIERWQGTFRFGIYELWSKPQS